MPPEPSSRRGRHPSIVLAALLTVVALTGCSQLPGIVEQILPERTSAHILVVGECFNNTLTILTTQDALVDVPRENCTLGHDNEVIASIQVDGAIFPGDDALIMQGFKSCLPEFEEFIGVGFEDAGTLEYDFFVPSATSWELGDREILCFAFDSAAQTAYTLEGQGAERAAAVENPEGETETEAEAES